MILATALNMMLSTLGGIKTLADGFAPDARSILVFAVLWAVHFAVSYTHLTLPTT